MKVSVYSSGDITKEVQATEDEFNKFIALPATKKGKQTYRRKIETALTDPEYYYNEELGYGMTAYYHNKDRSRVWFFKSPLTGIKGVGLAQPIKVKEDISQVDPKHPIWSDPKYVAQMKHNGLRLLAYIHDTHATWSTRRESKSGGLTSRTGIMDYITFPPSVFGSTLDCEIVQENVEKVPEAITTLQACYREGTLVATDIGAVPIESLEDCLIDTPDGLSEFELINTDIQEVYEVCTKRGVTFNPTPNTLIQVFRNGLIQVRADELNEGDILPLSRKESYGGSSVKFTSTFNANGKKDFSTDNDPFIWSLFGQILGDGCFVNHKKYNCYNYILLMFNHYKDTEALAFFKRELTVRGIGFTHKLKVDKRDRPTPIDYIRIFNGGLFEYFQSIGLSPRSEKDFTANRRKFIPSVVFSLPVECRNQLLRFWFNSDGGFLPNGEICLTSCNHDLIRQAQQLLYSLDINSYLKFYKTSKNNDTLYGRLFVSDKQKFRDNIGFCEEYKNSRSSYSDKQCIRLPLSVKQWIVSRISPEVVKQFPRILRDNFRRFSFSSDKLSLVYDLLPSDVQELLKYRWDYIDKLLSKGEYQTWDISLSNKSKLYFLNSGIVTHNTIRTININEAEGKERMKDWGYPYVYVFDLTALKGEDISDKPYEERLAAASAVVAETGNPYLKMVKTIRNDKYKFYKDIIDSGLEGIVMKDIQGGYNDPKFAFKIKRTTTFDGFIYGYIQGKGKYSDQVGGLKLGTSLPSGKWVHLCTVNVGSDEERRWVTENQDNLIGTVYELIFQEFSKNAPQHPRLAEGITHPRVDKTPQNSITEEGMVPPHIWKWYQEAPQISVEGPLPGFTKPAVRTGPLTVRENSRRKEIIEQTKLVKDTEPVEVTKEEQKEADEALPKTPLQDASYPAPGSQVTYRGRPFTFIEPKTGGVQIQNSQGKKYFIGEENWNKFYKP